MMEQKKLSRPNKLEELFLFQSTHSLRSATDVVTARQVIFINEGWKGVNLG